MPPQKRPKFFSSNIGFMGITMTGMVPRVTKKKIEQNRIKNKRATAENVSARAARGPYFLTKMNIKIEIFMSLTPFLFYIK